MIVARVAFEWLSSMLIKLSLDIDSSSSEAASTGDAKNREACDRAVVDYAPVIKLPLGVVGRGRVREDRRLIVLLTTGVVEELLLVLMSSLNARCASPGG